MKKMEMAKAQKLLVWLWGQRMVELAICDPSIGGDTRLSCLPDNRCS